LRRGVCGLKGKSKRKVIRRKADSLLEN
jgi:hypothetical protein